MGAGNTCFFVSLFLVRIQQSSPLSCSLHDVANTWEITVVLGSFHMKSNEQLLPVLLHAQTKMAQGVHCHTIYSQSASQRICIKLSSSEVAQTLTVVVSVALIALDSFIKMKSITSGDFRAFVALCANAVKFYLEIDLNIFRSQNSLKMPFEVITY